MTRILRIRFRRLVIVAAMGAGILALALGTSAAASAATTGGYPTPTDTPTVLKTYPPKHHKHEPPREVCFYSLLTEHDVIPNGDNNGDNGGPVYAAPASTAPAYGQPNGDRPRDEREAVEVVQLVHVCVTEDREHNGDTSWGERNRDDDQVSVEDVTGPFAFVEPANGSAPTPSGLPDPIKSALAA